MKRWLLLVTLLSLASPPVGLVAQDNGGCSYDECAIRVEPGGFFSEPNVVRGLDGTVVAEQGRSDELRALFGPSDSAAVHFESFTRSDLRSDLLTGVAGALTIAAFAVVLLEDEWNGWAVGLEVGSLLAGFTAIFPRRNADRAFSRAVWWYNRDLSGTDATSDN